MTDLVPVRRALLSLSDKSGLEELAAGLARHGIEIVSTGGTAARLREHGAAVRDISELTGFPEMMDGRVKTLHPKVHGGLLGVRDNPEHVAAMEAHGIGPIDLVVVNLYPFLNTVISGAERDAIIENIDIGGPSLIRAAAKNHAGVAVVTGPDQYAAVLDEMRANKGALSQATREQLMGAAFARTAAYDRAIAAYFAGGSGAFPDRLQLEFTKRSALRYGENPHQPAAFYAEPKYEGASVATAEVLNGKELSYNNLLDLDSALNLVREFRSPAACVIKHNNPCGAALGETLTEAFQKAYEGDPVSAFGGILAFNRELDEATATLITEPNRFVEAIIAPGYSEAALKLLTTRPKWGKNVRILSTGRLEGGQSPFDYRRIDGGLLVQVRDAGGDDFADAKVVTKRAPTDAERDDLMFAWRVCKHVKSNAIVLAKGRMVVGVGAGQMSRIDSTEIAIKKAGERVRGSVLASDAFFPFRDNIDAAAKACVTAIAEPGGSVRDAEAIAACDENDIAMLFTGVRHFRH
jgi:phosphoribosylaminoimidazolecarboxamide formyltransferase / IMP cyclohydrolase